ncbi:MAG: hypothetical protein ABI169_08025 [Chitinophagaceae bacterium]
MAAFAMPPTKNRKRYSEKSKRINDLDYDVSVFDKIFDALTEGDFD